MSLFIVLPAFFFAFFGGSPLACNVAARLRHLPRSYWIKFCDESLTCFAMTCRGLTSPDVILARSDKTLPPVRNVSRPTALTPLRRTCQPAKTDHLKSCLFRVRVARRVGPNKSDQSRLGEARHAWWRYYCTRSLWILAGVVCIDIYWWVYHGEKRRKYSTIFVDTSLSLNLAVRPSVSVSLFVCPENAVTQQGCNTGSQIRYYSMSTGVWNFLNIVHTDYPRTVAISDRNRWE